MAKSQGVIGSPLWRRVERMMIFPEVEEFCLGVSTGTTHGAGSGPGFAKSITEALWTAVEQGMKDLNHFEQVQLFRKGIGRDRISDSVGKIIRHRFAAYTKQICDEIGIPTQKIQYQNGIFDFDADRWKSKYFHLPMNPYNNKPIMLVPKAFLRDQPSINKDDFWSYCADHEGQFIAENFSDEILKKAEAEVIVAIAISNPEIRSRYITYREEMGSEPYDGLNDPKGFINWYQETKQYVIDNPLDISVKNDEDFIDLVLLFIQKFKNYIENQGGWTTFWNDNKTAKSENAVQFVFLGIVKHYCDANGIDISREPNIGRGPVDFKFSNGSEHKAVLEVKLIKNSKFWQGLSKQLVKYQEAEEAKLGVFLPIALRDKDIEKIIDIEAKVKAVNDITKYNIQSIVVDGRHNPLSASKL